MSAPATLSTSMRDAVVRILSSPVPVSVAASYSHATGPAQLHPSTANALSRNGLATYDSSNGNIVTLTEEGWAAALRALGNRLTDAQIDTLRILVEHGASGAVTSRRGLPTPSAVDVLARLNLAAIERNDVRATTLGSEVLGMLREARISAAREAEHAGAVAAQAAADERHALVIAIEPYLARDEFADPVPVPEELRTVEEPVTALVDSVMQTVVRPSAPPSVRAHVALAARLAVLDEQMAVVPSLGGADSDELSAEARLNAQTSVALGIGARRHELGQTMAALVEIGVIEQPVPVSGGELDVITLLRQNTTVGMYGIKVGERIHDDGSTADAEHLVAMWRRGLLDYAGGGAFLLAERGERAWYQTRPGRRPRGGEARA